MRRPAIATGLWIPLGESAPLDDRQPSVSRGFSHFRIPRPDETGASCQFTWPAPPLPILTRQHGSYIVMGEVKA
jgi:hypothetical protein